MKKLILFIKKYKWLFIVLFTGLLYFFFKIINDGNNYNIRDKIKEIDKKNIKAETKLNELRKEYDKIIIKEDREIENIRKMSMRDIDNFIKQNLQG